jgi:DNA-directed RNA polymerase subunit M/transcription elongation factor TFIIS
LATGMVFSCPKCNQLFEGSEEMRGRKGKCHACGEVFTIQLKDSAGAELSEVRQQDPLKSSRQKPLQPKGSVSKSKSTSGLPTVSDSRQKPSATAAGGSSTMQLACAKCQGIMEVPVSAAGQTTNCPFCQQLLKIPQPKKKASRNQSLAQPVSQSPQAVSSPLQPLPIAHSRGTPASQPTQSATPAVDDVWADLGDLSGVANPYSTPVASTGSDAWQPVRQRSRVRGLTFGNVFRLTFDSLFPNCLLASVLFGVTAVVGVVSVLLAGFVGNLLYESLKPETQLGAYFAILTPVIIVMIIMHFISNAALCMTCNAALHTVRGKPVTTQVLFGTGSAYGGMLVLMFAGTGLNLLTRFGIPYFVSGWHAAGQSDTAIVVGGTLLIVMFIVQLALFFMLATVPYALLDGESLPTAIGTSCSILFGNFLTVFGVIVCGWLLYLAVSLVSCGLGMIALLGAPFYLYAAIYHLASK